MCDVGVQCELNHELTVRSLPLNQQGYPESYLVNFFSKSHNEVPLVDLQSNELLSKLTGSNSKDKYVK